MEGGEGKNGFRWSMGGYFAALCRCLGISEDKGKTVTTGTHVRWLLRVWPFVFAVLILVYAHKIESALYPVVAGFTVDSIRHEPGLYTISGTMNKVRNCVFKGITASSDALILGLEYGDDITRSTNTRPVGEQPWGPWHIHVPEIDNLDHVVLVATHKCHPFGMTRTKLVTILLPK